VDTIAQRRDGRARGTARAFRIAEQKTVTLRFGVIMLAFLSIAASAQDRRSGNTVYAPSACPTIVASPAADTIDRLVAAQMRRERIPAVQLAVSRAGRVRTRVYGYSDLEHCVRADANSIFAIGSVSKQLTAYATLRLVEAGKLALDDSITKYLPESRPAWNGITIRHLLTHTSGIRDYGGDDPVYPQLSFDRRAEYTADSLVRFFASAPLNFRPGSEFAYSNTGYYMLSIVLERVAGMPFFDVMRTLVYEPLGMRLATAWNPRSILPNLATGYGTYDDTLQRGSYRGASAGRWGGDTGLLATAADLARFQWELLHPRFLSAAHVRLMTSRDTLSDGTTVFYGFGIQPTDVRGVPMWMHSGAFVTGYTAFVASFPTRDLAVTIVANSHTAQPWLLVMNALPLLDPALRAVPASRVRDADTLRTARLRRLFEGDSTALTMTPEFGRFQYGVVRRRFREAHFQSFTFLGCDDLRHSTAALPRGVTSECYFRVESSRGVLVLGVYFTADGAVADVRTKG